MSQYQPLLGKVAVGKFHLLAWTSTKSILNIHTVTGSSRDIGTAIALKLASFGADVVINYVSLEAPAKAVTAAARKQGVRAICVRADVSKRGEIANLFRKAVSELAHVDIIMSNSGIEHFGNLEDVKEGEIDRVLAVNIKS